MPAIQISLSKINPKLIVEMTSERHCQTVIEDLLTIIKLQKAIVDEVDTLNVHCNSIGSGKMARMKELVERLYSEVEFY